jgi:hypothetical protein
MNIKPWLFVTLTHCRATTGSPNPFSFISSRKMSTYSPNNSHSKVLLHFLKIIKIRSRPNKTQNLILVKIDKLYLLSVSFKVTVFVVVPSRKIFLSCLI